MKIEGEEGGGVPSYFKRLPPLPGGDQWIGDESSGFPVGQLKIQGKDHPLASAIKPSLMVVN